MDVGLSAADLDRALARFALEAPDGAQAQAVAEMRAALSFEFHHRTGDFAAGQQLETLLAHAQFGWTEIFRSQLFSVPRFVLSSDLCNACVLLVGGRPHILIGLGLLRALAYFQEWIHVGARAGTWLEAHDGLSPEDAHHVLYASFLPLVYHVRDGVSLPRLGSVLTEADAKGCFVGLATGTQFLLMHEIGHAALGHCETRSVGPTNLEMKSRAADRRRDQELEADRFVLDALRPAFRQFAAAYGFNIMMMAGLLERRLGQPTTHPIAAARMRALRDSVGDGRSPNFEAEYRDLSNWYAQLSTEGPDSAEGGSYDYGCRNLDRVIIAYREAIAHEREADGRSKANDGWQEIAAKLWPRRLEAEPP